MEFLTILVLAFAPGIFWLFISYRWDRYRPDPKSLVIRTFLLGIIAIVPVLIVETILMIPLLIANLDLFSAGFSNPLEAFTRLSTGEMAYVAFIIAGFTEELFKFLVVRTTIYRSPYFDDAADGLVYASAAALGFASIENVFYLLQFGWETILLRGPISTLAHVLFAILWGYPLALKKTGRRHATGWLWMGLIGSMAAHGLFNFVVFNASWYQYLIIPIMIGMIIVLNLMIRHSRRVSSYRNTVAELQKTCPQCTQKTAFYSRFCSNCGFKFTNNQENQISCGNCGQSLPSKAAYCTLCGHRNVKKPWR